MTVVLNICAFLAWVADERLAQSEQAFLSLQTSDGSRLETKALVRSGCQSLGATVQQRTQRKLTLIYAIGR